MSNNDRRTIASVLFGAAIVGSMLPNYVNVAAFFIPSMPAGWWWMGYFAAAVYDAAWASATWDRVTSPTPGRWATVMLVGGVAGAVGINLRQAWLLAGTTGVGWTVDAVVGHAALPIIGFAAVHALAAYLRAVPPDVADTSLAVVAPVTRASVPADVAAAGWTWEAARDHVAETGQVPAPFATRSELAAHFGKHPSRLSEATRARRNGAGGGE